MASWHEPHQGGFVEQLVLPYLAGTREAARDLIQEQGLERSLEGRGVLLLCQDLASGSTSFADELVKILLEERQAATIMLLGDPDRFAQHVAASASRRNFSGRVKAVTGAEAGV